MSNNALLDKTLAKYRADLVAAGVSGTALLFALYKAKDWWERREIDKPDSVAILLFSFDWRGLQTDWDKVCDKLRAIQNDQMEQQFTPGQYVRVRATIHEPWQVRIFHSWNERRPGSGAVPYARVMLKDGFQYDPNAATESFSMIEPWVPENEQWVFVFDFDDRWIVKQIYTQSCSEFLSDGCIAPLTLPPFVAVGDKY